MKAIRSSMSPTRKHIPISTVGRARSIRLEGLKEKNSFRNGYVDLSLGDSLEHYDRWTAPTVIVSDGGYGVLGFEGDTSDHLGLPAWYEPHVAAWSRKAKPATTLWFWNSEIGWAAVHPILEKHGWRYQNCNIWNKGLAHIAGNVNTARIRRFPVVSEVCVQYVFESKIDGMDLKYWLKKEWIRTGLPLRMANEACGLKDAAVRKYLETGHLWYFPPTEMFEKIQKFANEHGEPKGRPYFSADGKRPITGEQWATYRSKFFCPHGITNIWGRNPLSGAERIKAPSGKAVHLNQKPLDLISMTIEASSDPGDVVWEPFGGLFTASLAAYQLKRKAFAAELDPTYFKFGSERFKGVPL